jgi:hypothetical protein
VDFMDFQNPKLPQSSQVDTSDRLLTLVKPWQTDQHAAWFHSRYGGTYDPLVPLNNQCPSPLRVTTEDGNFSMQTLERLLLWERRRREKLMRRREWSEFVAERDWWNWALDDLKLATTPDSFGVALDLWISQLRIVMTQSRFRASLLVRDDPMLSDWVELLEYAYNVDCLRKFDYIAQLEWGVRFKFGGLDTFVIPDAVIPDATRALKIQFDILHNYSWSRATSETSARAWGDATTVYTNYDIFHQTRLAWEEVHRYWTPDLGDCQTSLSLLNLDTNTLTEAIRSLDDYDLIAWQVSDIMASLVHLL